MILTEKKAIELTLELWRWLAETGEDKKRWGKWREYGKMLNDCFFCEYRERRRSECQSSCPYFKKYGGCFGDNNDAPYALWGRARTPKDRKKYANEIVKQLEEL